MAGFFGEVEPADRPGALPAAGQARALGQVVEPVVGRGRHAEHGRIVAEPAQFVGEPAERDQVAPIGEPIGQEEDLATDLGHESPPPPRERDPAGPLGTILADPAPAGHARGGSLATSEGFSSVGLPVKTAYTQRGRAPARQDRAPVKDVAWILR